MKARVATQGGYIEVESETIKGLFEELAEAQEIFGARECDLCHSKDLVFRVRRPEGYVFYELHCNNCKGQFQFGQTREGGRLFPKKWGPGYSGSGSDDNGVF